jgi:excisionase family DNA binding protein
MSRSDSRDAEGDPWLTVSEAAAELRLNPATIRLWISKGQLIAVRAGARKLLIRRSDLDRTVAVLRGERPRFDGLPPTKHSRWQVRQLPPMSTEQLAERDSTDLRAEPGEIDRITDGIRRADSAWLGAQAASENAPPDAEFPHRLRALAEACDAQRHWLSRGGATKGFEWTPIADGRHMQISHELRPGANRPGRRHLWDQFDAAVDRLAYAMEHGPLYSVTRAYGELAGLMNEIADELLGESPDTRGQQQ